MSKTYLPSEMARAILSIPNISATVEGEGLKIFVIAPTDSIVTAEKDDITYTGVEDTQNPGKYIITTNGSSGEYIISYTNDINTRSKNIIVNPLIVNLNSLLPNGYVQLEYLGSTGQQYIDTGIITPNGLHADITCLLHGNGTNSYSFYGAIGAHGPTPGGSDGANGLNFNAYNSSIIIRNGGEDSYNGSKFNKDQKYSISFSSIVNNIWMKVNDEDVQLTIPSTIDNTRIQISNWLFGFNGGSDGLIDGWIGKIYSATIYSSNDDTEIGKFVPAKRIEDSALGMYDIIRRQFFTNAGSGNFIAGPEIDG